MIRSNRTVSLPKVFALSALALSSAQTFAQDTDKEAQANSLESIIVTGTRQANRTIFDSMAPVDLISGDAINDTISEDLLDNLAQLVPSFKVQRLPMADGQVFVRPASLRGMSSDHTLVLLNGKRLHRSALLGSNGAQAPDLATIPTSAIKRIEVLRDGASAQYGSDAIAGVINILLEDKEGYSAFTQFSQYYEGDGAASRAGAQGGWNLNDNGFLSLTAEYFDADRTVRSRQRPDAIEYQEAHPEVTLRNPVQDWGQPDREALRLALNSEYNITDETALYFYGTYGDGEGLSDFNWRNPNSAVFNQSEAYPDFNLLDLYPTGFAPHFGQEDTDLSMYAGVKGDIDDLSWDLSASQGSNEIDYTLSNSINASLGSDSPTAFNAGSLKQEETTVNFDGVYVVNANGLSDDINIGFGAEYREETYTVKAGDAASYAVGPAAVEGLPSGSNGFFGFSPAQSGEFSQNSKAVYIDVETNLTEAFTVGVAGRYEDFSVFGNSTNGKLSARYALNENTALRSTFSTGFRAPTPGQLFSERVSQGLDTNTLEVFTRGRYSPQGEIAAVINNRDDVTIESLQPEESDNLSFGITYQNSDGLNASLDFYRINVSERFGTSSTYTLTAQEREQLVTLGVTGAESITSVNFYQNDFDTRTTGVDAVISQKFDISAGTMNIVAAYNFNKTEVEDGNIVQNDTQRTIFEKRLPRHSANVAASYEIGDFTYQARARYYGKWTDSSGNADDDIFQTFSAETFVDLAVDYAVTENIELSFNIENLFDNYPDEATFQANRGLIYSRNAPYDTDGGSYSLRLDMQF